MKLRIFLVALILISVFCISTTALAMTESERQAMITQIQQQLIALLQQLDQVIVQEAANSSWCHTFNTNIGYNQSGTSEVAYLHIALLKQGISYNPDNVFTFSSNGTLQAVVQFQAKYGIYPQSGYVGPLTRAKLNQLYRCGTIVTGCTPNWQIGNWGTCYSNTQTRTVTDLNYCGTTLGKPSTTQSCSTTCSPNWSCGNWGTCYSNTQTRTCTDSHYCGITTDKPATTQPCTATCATFNYSSWSPSVCPPSGTQTRTITSSSPAGCTGGTPVTTQTCTPQPSIDIKANNSDGPLNLFLILGSGAAVNPSGGITLTLPINLSWTGFEVQSCSASDTLTPTAFSGFKSPNGSETATLSGTIPGTNVSDKVSDTLKITCITNTGLTVNNTVTVNLYYTVSGTCTPNWTCGSWGNCVSGHHTRTCTDSNGCGTARPADFPISESCTLALATINLAPTSANLTVGNTQQLTATKLDQEGNAISANLIWTSNNPSVATVNSNGLVTAVSAGMAIITASSGSVVSNGAQITAQLPPPTSITITPTSASLVVSGNPHTQQLTARNQNGLIITTVNWTSNHLQVATVDSNGLVTATGAGTAIITASSGSVTSNSSTITVIAAAPTVTISSDNLHPVPYGHFNVSWSSSNANSCAVKSIITKQGYSPETSILWTCSNDNVCALGSNIQQTAPSIPAGMEYTINCTNGVTATGSVTVSQTNWY